MNQTMKDILKNQQHYCANHPAFHEYRRFAFWHGYSEFADTYNELALNKLVSLRLFTVDWEGFYRITTAGLEYDVNADEKCEDELGVKS
jgi:hypothetical protein